MQFITLKASFAKQQQQHFTQKRRLKKNFNFRKSRLKQANMHTTHIRLRIRQVDETDEALPDEHDLLAVGRNRHSAVLRVRKLHRGKFFPRFFLSNKEKENTDIENSGNAQVR